MSLTNSVSRHASHSLSRNTLSLSLSISHTHTLSLSLPAPHHLVTHKHSKTTAVRQITTITTRLVFFSSFMTFGRCCCFSTNYLIPTSQNISKKVRIEFRCRFKPDHGVCCLPFYRRLATVSSPLV